VKGIAMNPTLSPRQCTIHNCAMASYGNYFFEYTCKICNDFRTYSQNDLGKEITRYCLKCSRNFGDKKVFTRTKKKSMYYSCPICWDELLQK